ncbi:MAG: aspartate/glutamate racemase family protein [Chitinophagaceae bacterium]|nr:aspartate/glutamate racemase family protein [Chitinophagaceae bacterium]
METKRKLGIIGGMGARAGVTFLQKIIDLSPANADQEFVEIIYHNNPHIPDRTQAILYKGASPHKELLRSVRFLNRSKVDVIVMACMTSYYFIDELSKHTHAYFPDPVALLAGYLKTSLPLQKRVGLLASTGAIRSGIFHRRLEQEDLSVVNLDEDDQENMFMRSLYMPTGLKSGNVSESARSMFLQAVDILQNKQIDVLIGGCSEVSILLPGDSLPVPFVDIMDLLAKDIIDYCYNKD